MRVVVHAHSGLGPRLATFNNATVPERSWLKNDAGQARLILPQGDSQANGLLVSASNVYVIESDQGAPVWVGYLPDRWIEDGQTVTLPLRELSYVLASRFTGPNDSYSGGAGGVLKQTLQKALRQAPLPFELGSFADPGPYTARSWRTNRLLDAAQQLEGDSGYLWWIDAVVTPNRIRATLRWGRRRGRDRTREVLLEEGRNLKAYPQFEDRTGQPIGQVTVIGQTSGGTAFAARPQATAIATPGSTLAGASASAASSASDVLGGHAVVIDEHLGDTHAALEAAQTQLATGGGRLLRLVVAAPSLWAKIGMDDELRVRLPRYNLGRGLDTTVSVTGIQPDETNGELLLTTEVVSA